MILDNVIFPTCLVSSLSSPPGVQVQQKLTELRVEERSVTAQLSWKRALEDSSPVLVNGSVGPTAELHHGDLFLVEDHPFHQLKEDEDEDEEEGAGEEAEVLEVAEEDEEEEEDDDDEEEEEEEESGVTPLKKQCEEPRAEEEKADEGNEKSEGTRPQTPEEKKPKQDALDDLYSSLASGDLYNSLGFTRAKDNNNIIIMVGNLYKPVTTILL